MIVNIVDYGIGNVHAFLNAFARLGIDASCAHTPEELIGSTHLILPGVGNFDRAMQRLNNSGMRARLEELVLGSKVPVLGVCVGMQMLSHGSDEGSLRGLGWVPGRVRAIATAPNCSELLMPHMGWNNLRTRPQSKLFSKGFDKNPQFYFLHSFIFDAEDKSDVDATAYYGLDFDAAVSRRNIHGVQFHPEKSHHWGEQLLKNFLDL